MRLKIGCKHWDRGQMTGLCLIYDVMNPMGKLIDFISNEIDSTSLHYRIWRLFFSLWFEIKTVEGFVPFSIKITTDIKRRKKENCYTDTHITQSTYLIRSLFIIFSFSSHFLLSFCFRSSSTYIKDLDTRIIIGSFSHELAPKIFCEVRIYFVSHSLNRLFPMLLSVHIKDCTNHNK